MSTTTTIVCDRCGGTMPARQSVYLGAGRWLDVCPRCLGDVQAVWATAPAWAPPGHAPRPAVPAPAPTAQPTQGGI